MKQPHFRLSDPPVVRPSWDEWFLGLAKYVSQRSKDPSTQCGAVIVRPDNTIASLGYNGFPRSISDDAHLLMDREEKLKRIIHAEMNALLNGRGEDFRGCTLYVWPFLTCERCAVHVIQAGIVKVMAPAPDMKQLERWHHSFTLARNLYRESGVVVNEELQA